MLSKGTIAWTWSEQYESLIDWLVDCGLSIYSVIGLVDWLIRWVNCLHSPEHFIDWLIECFSGWMSSRLDDQMQQWTERTNQTNDRMEKHLKCSLSEDTLFCGVTSPIPFPWKSWRQILPLPAVSPPLVEWSYPSFFPKASEVHLYKTTTKEQAERYYLSKTSIYKHSHT